MQDADFGDSFLSGKTEGVWDEEKRFRDFVVPKTEREVMDAFTEHTASFLLSLKGWAQRNRRTKLLTISSPVMAKLSKALVTIIASIFPVLPIIILFFIDRLLIRLGLVLAFTACFALVLVFGLGIESGRTLAITTA